MRLGWGLSSPAPDAAQQECCEPGSTLLCMGLFSRFFVQALPCTAEGTLCRVRDTRSLVPRAYGTNRSNSNTSCSRTTKGPIFLPRLVTRHPPSLVLAAGGSHAQTYRSRFGGTHCPQRNHNAVGRPDLVRERAGSIRDRSL